MSFGSAFEIHPDTRCFCGQLLATQGDLLEPLRVFPERDLDGQALHAASSVETGDPASPGKYILSVSRFCNRSSVDENDDLWLDLFGSVMDCSAGRG